jgi:ATP-dependent Clp protease ATP-binding subunit ClpA
VSIVLPFLPFSEGEQAVVAHKYVLELQNKVLQSIQISGHQLVGRIILDVKRDGAICRLIAADGYDPDQGARSLKSAVETRIEDELVQRYLEEDGKIDEYQPVVKYTVDLARNGVLSVFKSRN